MPVPSLPPFPDNVPVHPLIVVDYEKLVEGDEQERQLLWKAATELGFWYVKNHGIDEVSGMYDMGQETMDLPLDEKMKFDQGDAGMSFGYKAAGVWDTDGKNTPDNTEFLNISFDDALSYPVPTHRTYPSTVNAAIANVIRPFMLKSREVNNKLMDLLGDMLGLPEEWISKVAHKEGETSGTESRNVRNAARTNRTDSEKSSLGAHTDFGSITFLHNRLGGLQVLVPSSNTWQYVRPVPGWAICNLGDAMTVFSGGILRSNMHRVISPPGAQAAITRASLAFLSRPGDSVELRPLADLSEMVREAIEKGEKGRWETGCTAGEWFNRRVKYHRISNLKKDPSQWQASRGTEHTPDNY